MIEQSYLSRLKDRKTEQEIKDCAAFGIFFGGILFLVSGWFAYFSTVNHQNVWGYVCKFSILIFICGIVIPQLLLPLQRIVSGFGNFIFSILFKFVLSVLFLLIITPIGFVQKKYSKYSFCNWNNINEIKGIAEDWKDKNFTYSLSEYKKIHDSIFFKSLALIKFFIEKKQWILLPAIIIIIILGLIFAFIQSSLVAPLIYTVF